MDPLHVAAGTIFLHIHVSYSSYLDRDLDEVINAGLGSLNYKYYRQVEFESFRMEDIDDVRIAFSITLHTTAMAPQMPTRTCLTFSRTPMVGPLLFSIIRN